MLKQISKERTFLAGLVQTADEEKALVLTDISAPTGAFRTKGKLIKTKR